MATADEKLRELLGAEQMTHESCVADCKKAYDFNTGNCRNMPNPADRERCLTEARGLLESCINGCPNTIVKENAGKVVDIITGS